MEDDVCPPSQVWFDDDPELPFDEDWGVEVKAARIKAKLTQGDLATKVNVKQSMISYIESGQVLSSVAVMPLVRLLGVSVPVPSKHFDDEERRWVQAGRALRRVNEAGFRGLLAAAEEMIARADKKPPEH